jgi:hypothetical protein
MGENFYVDKLAWFKQNEKPEVVLMLADDPERIGIVIAWTNINVKPAETMTELVNTYETGIWDWLWENTLFSHRELKEKTGTSLSEIGLENKMRPLIGNRIIYPDGTVNSYVQRYLRERVVHLFENKKKPNIRKPLR